MISKVNLTIANMYLVRERRTILVDSGAPGNAARIRGALRRAGIDEAEVSLILLTHGHSDHAGSAAELRQALGVPVAAHAGDLPLLRAGRNGEFVNMGLEAAVSRRFVDRPFPAFEPDILLTEDSDLTAFGVDARLMHTPGHSDGSLTLLFPNGDAIAGDILRGGVMGGTFLPGRPAHPYFMPARANLPQLHDSIRRVLAAGAQALYVGHGGPLSRAAVAAWADDHIGAAVARPAG